MTTKRLTINSAFNNGRWFEKKRILRLLTKDENLEGIPMENLLKTIEILEKETKK